MNKTPKTTKINPFIAEAEVSTRIGAKKILSRGAGLCTIKNSTGEALGNANFVHSIPVDKTAFVKMYAAGIAAHHDLNKAGQTIFKVLFDEVQNYPGKDELYINFEIIDQSKIKISRATYQRGLKSLLENSIIAKSNRPGIYFLNVHLMFNGDRLNFLKQYHRKNF